MRLSTRVPGIHRNRNANNPTDHRLTSELKLSARPKFCNSKLNLQLQFKTREILLLLDIGLADWQSVGSLHSKRTAVRKRDRSVVRRGRSVGPPVPIDGEGEPPCQNTFCLNSSYVCPEPVLVKDDHFHYQKRLLSKKTV
jgi:hypothetical protein